MAVMLSLLLVVSAGLQVAHVHQSSHDADNKSPCTICAASHLPSLATTSAQLSIQFFVDSHVHTLTAGTSNRTEIFSFFIRPPPSI